jgi:NAD(P)-dependent dehydrogenase (short-subunit alcohol dehydrogenase family)
MILQDKVIIIAGGTGDIGSVTAVKVAQAGAKVIVPFRRTAAAEKLKQQAGTLAGQFLMVESDGNSVAAMQKVVEAARQKFGRIDGLANLIGGFAAGRVDETDESAWHTQMQTNLHPAFYAARAVLPLMRAQKYGRIVFTASISALSPSPGLAAYVVSKSALVTLAKIIAAENKQQNILVHVIAPGMVNTDANRQSISGDPANLVQPEEIAELIIYFLSDHIRHSTGNVIEIPTVE